MQNGFATFIVTALQPWPTKQFIIQDRRTLLNSTVFSTGTAIVPKFVFIPLLGNVHILHVSGKRNVWRLFSHVSGYSGTSKDGAASLPEGFYTAKIFNADYFQARFECDI